MFKAVRISLCAILGAATAICAAAAEDERRFELDAFNKVKVSAGVILVATAGDEQSIIVKTDDGDFSDFTISVEDNALRVSRDNNRLRWHSKKASYKVIVTAPVIRSLRASSGAHAKVYNINGPRINVDISSGAHATVEGEAEKCVIDLSSGAHFSGKKLACDHLSIDVSSGGHGKVRATSAVNADASSGGHVTVYGNPVRVSADKSSGGRIYLSSND